MGRWADAKERVEVNRSNVQVSVPIQLVGGQIYALSPYIQKIPVSIERHPMIEIKSG